MSNVLDFNKRKAEQHGSIYLKPGAPGAIFVFYDLQPYSGSSLIGPFPDEASARDEAKRIAAVSNCLPRADGWLEVRS